MSRFKEIYDQYCDWLVDIVSNGRFAKGMTDWLMTQSRLSQSMGITNGSCLMILIFQRRRCQIL